MKWASVGLAISLPAFFAGDALLHQIDDTPTGILAYFGFSLVMTLAGLVFPVTLAIAVLRYRLLDIDIVINRVLIYGILTFLVVLAYVGIVLGVGALIRDQHSLVSSLIATATIAVAFQPARDRVQRLIDRAFFGNRENPYAVAAALGRELERVVTPEEVLPAVVDSLARSLHLPYAAIILDDHRRPSGAAAASGTRPQLVETIPLSFQGEPLGSLEVAPRAPGESLSLTDWRLLEDLARQIGVAVHSVRATRDLQLARQRLVTAREEERRRLRRDLHDGLGARLAGLSMQASAMRTMAPTDPDAAAAVAADLANELRMAIADVRRLVHDLRPPALDELGLRAALEERARAIRTSLPPGSPPLDIAVISPDPPLDLSAAIEVAVYWIAEEALTNVVRHSQATRCRVEITAGPPIGLRIADNGTGLHDAPWGVGFASMRERALELGGSLATECGLDGRGLAIAVAIPAFDPVPDTSGPRS
jgi:signal transduction histidine kinase